MNLKQNEFWMFQFSYGRSWQTFEHNRRFKSKKQALDSLADNFHRYWGAYAYRIAIVSVENNVPVDESARNPINLADYPQFRGRELCTHRGERFTVAETKTAVGNRVVV